MATPNYSYEKRQKELAKKRKKEEKLKKKSDKGDSQPFSGDTYVGTPPSSGEGGTPSGS